MSAQIDNFYDDLRTNMTTVEVKLNALKATAKVKVDEAERAIRQQINTIQKKIDKSKAAVEAAKVKGKEWAEVQKAAAQTKLAEWKDKGDAKSLQARADLADAYASAMSTIASSAVDEAARAALEALLAHYDVETGKMTRAVR